MKNVFKRIFDVALAVTMLVALLPVLLVIALAVKLSGRGPVIFRQQRAGRDGVPFTLYKFRTMRMNVDPFGPSPESGIDPRLTGVGRWLREFSLDEAPQLVNIVKGDMSFVGPRPLYVSQVAEWNERQRQRLCVRPGLTGLAQISGRGMLTCEEKFDLDVRYVETAGLGLDVKIMFATAMQVLGRRGIYEKRYSRSMRTRRKET